MAATNQREGRPSAKIAFGHLRLLNDWGEDLADALRESLVPGAAHTRYGRTWRLGQWQDQGDTILGRLGFDAVGGVAEVWNEDLKDFEEQQLPQGTTSPFVVRLSDARVAFQLRPGKIRPRGFTGALQGLLNDGQDFYRWRVELDLVRVSWERWRKTVDRVVKINARVERPNPHYQGRADVERIIEGGNLELFRFIAVAADGALDGIDVEDEFIRQIVDHGQEYGLVRATGETTVAGETTRSEWRSDMEGVPPEAVIDADPTTREAEPDALRREVLRDGTDAAEGAEIIPEGASE